MNICICGGGGLGHTTAGVFSSMKGIQVSMLTGHPEKWQNPFRVNDPNGHMFCGKIFKASHNPAELILGADMVLLCLPAYLVEQTLRDIKPFLQNSTIVGSVVGNTGFFVFAHQILPSTTPLFAFQRVPFISRVITYGEEAKLLGYKSELLVATENISQVDWFCQRLSELFLTPVFPLDSFYEVTLSNSNPILHTGRLYTMWKDWDGSPYAENPLFYYGWTVEASEIEIAMDAELFALLNALNVSTKHIKTLLNHYEVSDARSLTQKLKSIPSYAELRSPMKKVEGGWIPDFESRYFTEDFPYGLRMIHDLAQANNVHCPTIDKVYDWGIKMIRL